MPLDIVIFLVLFVKCPVSLKVKSKAPTVKYIGWDVAYSDSGWVLIEGNMGQFIGPQTIYKIGIKKQVQEYLKDMEPIPRIIANKE